MRISAATGCIWSSKITDRLNVDYRKKSIHTWSQIVNEAQTPSNLTQRQEIKLNASHIYSTLSALWLTDVSHTTVLFDENTIFERAKYFYGDKYDFLNSTIAHIACMLRYAHKHKMLSQKKVCFFFNFCIFFLYFFFVFFFFLLFCEAILL